MRARRLVRLELTDLEAGALLALLDDVSDDELDTLELRALARFRLAYLEAEDQAEPPTIPLPLQIVPAPAVG